MTTTDPDGGSMPSVNPQSFNRYSYVQNDPVNFVDPTGLMMWCFTYDTFVQISTMATQSPITVCFGSPDSDGRGSLTFGAEAPAATRVFGGGKEKKNQATPALQEIRWLQIKVQSEMKQAFSDSNYGDTKNAREQGG